MILKKLLSNALFINAREYHYRSCGYSETTAYALAARDLREQEQPSNAASNNAEIMARLEKSRTHYNETMSALAERRRKLYEENPWLLEQKEQAKKD